MTTAKFQPNWPSLQGYKVPHCYQDAKSGIFIHWGVYAVPAFGNEWYPRNIYLEGAPEYEHHINTYSPHTQFGYKNFIPHFTASNYDPARWAKLFDEVGAKYVVPVAEHHDGFAMYDSNFPEWTAAKIGPRRELIGELVIAVRQDGLVIDLSSHGAENWFFYNGGCKFPSTDVVKGFFNDTKRQNFTNKISGLPSGRMPRSTRFAWDGRTPRLISSHWELR